MTKKESNSIVRIVTILTGNGDSASGLVGDVKDIKRNMVTHVTCLAAREACEAVRVARELETRKWWRSAEHIIVLVLAVLTLIFGSGIYLRSRTNSRQNAVAIEQNEEALKLLRELKQGSRP